MGILAFYNVYRRSRISQSMLNIEQYLYEAEGKCFLAGDVKTMIIGNGKITASFGQGEMALPIRITFHKIAHSR